MPVNSIGQKNAPAVLIAQDAGVNLFRQDVYFVKF